MALLFAGAARLKPDIRLAQAISEFEADLSPEQKALFRSYKNQSISSPPSINDVMRLTAEVDRNTGKKINGSRCFGPRLTNVLQAVQQFAAIGDVVIGGSQNLIACGVWALVRMVLISFATMSSQMEKLSMLFMNIGRSSPRYEKLGLLYPQSKDLQSYLYEYYTVIVRLCHDLFKVTRKSVLIQAWHFLGESDVKTYETDLESLAKAMNEEVNLLMARGIEKQKSKLSSLSKHSEFSLHQHKQKLHFQVLESCSKYDHQQVWKQVRKSGTSILLDQSPIYQEWKDRDISSTLVCKGKLGSGKSVLLANIVDDLNIHVQNRNIPVTYFFCRHDIDESLKTRTILGSLARQLLLGSISDNVVSDFNGRPPSVLDDDEIVLLLQRALEPTFRAYFVLDGVDECDRHERKTLCYHLHRLQKIFTLQVCFSFRIEADTDQELDIGTFVNCSVLTIPENNPDIDGYIYSELERRIESRQLALGNPTIALEIRDALQEGAHGMFLWVTLQIDSLCFAETDEAIRIALQNLPKDLPETFLRILQRSQKKTGSHHQKRILELCAIACRPLSTEELREALSVEPGNTNWDPSRLINDIYKVLSCCGSLIVVDEEDSTVRLVHHSLKQFMLGGFGKQADITFTEECANEVMADIITTYMNYGIFDNQVSTIVAPQIVAQALPSKIIRSTFDFSNIAGSLAVRALQSRQQPDYNIGDFLLKESGRFNRYSAEEVHFIIYAKSHWLHHILHCSPMNSKTLELLVRLLEKDVVAIDTESNIDKLLEIAMRNRYEALTRILIDKDIHEVHNTRALRHSQLHTAHIFRMPGDNRGRIFTYVPVNDNSPINSKVSDQQPSR